MRNLKVFCVFGIMTFLSAPPVFAATPLKQCVAAPDLDATFNPALKDEAKYCGCFLRAVAASPELSAEVKNFYSQKFSTEAAFAGPNGQYIGLDANAAKAYASKPNTSSPEQNKQNEQIEFIRLNCFSEN